MAEKPVSERVRLNRAVKTINEMQDQTRVEVMKRNKDTFQVILYGERCNLVFIDDFEGCQGYLWGVRDMVTVQRHG